MQFQGIYLNAMRERAPRMFNELRRSGKIAAHAREKEQEFGRLVNEALKAVAELGSSLASRSGDELDVFAGNTGAFYLALGKLAAPRRGA